MISIFRFLATFAMTDGKGVLVQQVENREDVIREGGCAIPLNMNIPLLYLLY